MALARGPFTIEWGDTLLGDIEEIDVEYDVDSEDYTSVQGRTYTIPGAHKATATITLLSTDIPALTAVLPQYKKNNGQVMSSGETVMDPNGAIDLVPGGCDSPTIYQGLIITSCGNPGQVFRMLNTRTEIAGVEFDDKIRKVQVQFIGEPDQTLATIQFFKEGALGSIS